VNIPTHRLVNHGLTRPLAARIPELVARLGAVQAQEYPFAKWGLALRLQGAVSDRTVEQAHTDGEILRTHVMRPTWHFVAAGDIVWMLELTAPRVHVAMRTYMRHQGLDVKLMTRSAAVFERALAGGQYLTRAELGARLARARIKPNAMQLAGIAMYAELEGIICSGPRRGRDATYALISERAPSAGRLSTDEALATLATRFFASHGPATLRDFVWWSGLRTADARRGIDIARLTGVAHDGLTYIGPDPAPVPARAPVRPLVHLLPIYDEYTVAYRDRQAVPHGPAHVQTPSAMVTFRHTLVIDGHIAGTWRTTKSRSGLHVCVTPLRPLTSRERAATARAVDRYATFLGAQLQLTIE
jgi:hypothetical protein